MLDGVEPDLIVLQAIPRIVVDELHLEVDELPVRLVAAAPLLDGDVVHQPVGDRGATGVSQRYAERLQLGADAPRDLDPIDVVAEQQARHVLAGVTKARGAGQRPRIGTGVVDQRSL